MSIYIIPILNSIWKTLVFGIFSEVRYNYYVFGLSYKKILTKVVQLICFSVILCEKITGYFRLCRPHSPLLFIIIIKQYRQYDAAIIFNEYLHKKRFQQEMVHFLCVWFVMRVVPFVDIKYLNICSQYFKSLLIFRLCYDVFGSEIDFIIGCFLLLKIKLYNKGSLILLYSELYVNIKANPSLSTAPNIHI